MKNLFINVGKKIQALAKIIFGLEIIGSLAGAIIFWCDEEVGMGFIIFICGPLFSLISSWFLYGFGLIVENNEVSLEKESQTENKSNQNKKKCKSKGLKVLEANIIGTCDFCNLEKTLTKVEYKNKDGTFYYTICKDCLDKNNDSKANE